jgi:hypothetical protein
MLVGWGLAGVILGAWLWTMAVTRNRNLQHSLSASMHAVTRCTSCTTAAVLLLMRRFVCASACSLLRSVPR